MPALLCYGDSNTYGYDAATGGRFSPEVRWPGMLAASLPAGWRVIEEGLGGRTTVHDDPELEHTNGLTYLEPCLYSHLPLDVVVLFLGLNDLKPRLQLDADGVAAGVRTLVERTLAAGVPRVLVLAPPRLGPFDPDDPKYAGAGEKAAALPAALRRVADELGVELLDLAEVTAFSDGDPWHLDAAGHAAVARAVAAALALGTPAVRELRLAVTAEDYDDALRFYRDVLGLRELADFSSPNGRVRLLEAGRATLELVDPAQAAFIDEVEVGRRVAGHIRVALEVADAAAITAALAAAGAEVIAEPTRTPWDSLNARLAAPAGLQLTLFEEPPQS